MSYEIKKTEAFRIRNKFSLFPFIYVNGFDFNFVWTGKWFTFVQIKEQRVFERYTEFDDGWSYKEYWGKWKECWKFIEMIEKK